MRALALLTVLLGAAAVAGCAGGTREPIVHEAHTEGIYVDVGRLDYQVQLSRQINPGLVPDRGYLAGLPEFVSPLTEDETWFGVFLRVQNQTDRPAVAADEFEIEDTVGNTYEPIEIDPEDNPLAYEPRELDPGDVYPDADSLAGDSPTQGGVLLFKMPYSSLGNRPLEFRIEADGQEAVVELDV